MKKTVLSIFLLSLCTLQMFGAKIKINDSWMFQKLNLEVERGEVLNQGGKWEDQFNVTHVASSAELQIAEEDLKAEFIELQNGTWEAISLPHIPRVEDFVVDQWLGVCYYKKTINPDESWNDKQILLEFEGAMQLADIWVNGNHVHQNAGGYNTFVTDISKHLKLNESNELLVRLDNRDNALIPPGKPINTLDFSYYGGIYRDVNLIVKPQIQITHALLANQVAGGGIFVTYSDISKESARIDIQTHLANISKTNSNLTLQQNLYEIDGLYGKGGRGNTIQTETKNLVLNTKTDNHIKQSINLVSPKLWSVDAPHLYELETLVLVDGLVVDKEITTIGVRHIEFTKEKGFLLNGEPIRLVGANRHMDYPYIGNSISDNAQYRDMYQMKENGFNVARLGHYPQDPSVLDACDELGLLVIEPIPGWQFFNKDEVFIELTHRDVRSMIRRDRNHASVIMWETTLNESWPPNEWKDAIVETAHKEYPGDQFYTAGDGYGYDGFDIVYNDWKDNYHRPNPGTKPGFIREYYDYEFGGHFSTTRIGLKDGEKALLQNAWNAQWSHNRYRAYYPQTSGDAVWSMYDYNRGCCDNVCESGVADLFRLAKYSLPFFYSQLDVNTPLPSGKMKPYVFIANQWTKRDGKDDVIVFGNVDEVELKINGKSIKKQKKDNGKDTDYVKESDGGNCRNLNQAPFTFKDIKWEEGEVKAIGYVSGKALTETIVRTPKEVQTMSIEYFESGKKAAKDDILIVYVKLLDANGTLCPINDVEVGLSVDDYSQVMGDKKRTTEAGTASFIVKTGKRDLLSIKATSKIAESQRNIDLVD